MIFEEKQAKFPNNSKQYLSPQSLNIFFYYSQIMDS